MHTWCKVFNCIFFASVLLAKVHSVCTKIYLRVHTECIQKTLFQNKVFCTLGALSVHFKLPPLSRFLQRMRTFCHEHTVHTKMALSTLCTLGLGSIPHNSFRFQDTVNSGKAATSCVSPLGRATRIDCERLQATWLMDSSAASGAGRKGQKRLRTV